MITPGKIIFISKIMTVLMIAGAVCVVALQAIWHTPPPHRLEISERCRVFGGDTPKLTREIPGQFEEWACFRRRVATGGLILIRPLLFARKRLPGEETPGWEIWSEL